MIGATISFERENNVVTLKGTFNEEDVTYVIESVNYLKKQRPGSRPIEHETLPDGNDDHVAIYRFRDQSEYM